MLAEFGNVGGAHRFAAGHRLRFLDVRDAVVLAGFFDGSGCDIGGCGILDRIGVIADAVAYAAGGRPSIAKMQSNRIFGSVQATRRPGQLVLLPLTVTRSMSPSCRSSAWRHL